MKPSIVVTGVSTGIGWGITRILIVNGFRVFGSVRREIDAERLSQEFGEAFTPLLMDVTDRAAVDRAAVLVAAHLGTAKLAGLVNNAGIAVPGPLVELPLGDFRHQMEVNLVASLSVAQAFAPLLGVDRTRTGPPGRIVNISSVAGKIGSPFLGAYVASKHGLEGMSETLRRELMLFGIDVILVAPGAVITPMWDKGVAVDLSGYKASPFYPALEGFRNYFMNESKKGLTAEDVGLVVHTALTTRRPKVRYAVVPQKFKNWTLPRLLPRRTLDRLIGKQFGLK